jgi:hypothetical protein
MSGSAKRPTMKVRWWAAAALALVGAAGAKPFARSHDPPPPPTEGTAISQYVETLPSGSGGQAVGVGKAHTKPLPKPAAKKLAQKTTPLAPKLQSIATSSSYGAPQQTLPRKPAAKYGKKPQHPAATPIGGSDRPTEPARAAEPDRTALSAAVSAATGGGDRGPVILLAAIVVFTTAAGLTAAARRARQAR